MSTASSALEPDESSPHQIPRATRRHMVHAALRVGLFTVLLVALYALAPLGKRVDGFVGLELAFLLLVFLLTVAWELREIFRSSYPAIQAVEAVAISIPMLVLTFSSAYVALSTESVHSFSEPLTRVDAVYFSVTVFATVGFGDIVATTQVARLVVTLQMVADLILVGFIAKVLFGAVQHRRRALDAAPVVPAQDRSPRPAVETRQPPL